MGGEVNAESVEIFSVPVLACGSLELSVHILCTYFNLLYSVFTCSGGHDELVELLLNHGANIEHRDKKGCTPLILAASAGHAVTVAILLDHNADIEAQSDRTKDTALSLACSGGRQEVVELLLAKGANFEHRNVSDYTPLSLAASGGYVNIIKLLLRAGADINSRSVLAELDLHALLLCTQSSYMYKVQCCIIA